MKTLHDYKMIVKNSTSKANVYSAIGGTMASGRAREERAKVARAEKAIAKLMA